VAETFDETELLSRVDNDIGFLAETVEMLSADGPSLMDQLRQAVAAGDAAGVGLHAHALKGMISNFCAPAAQSAAVDLERLGKGGDLTAVAPGLETLDRHVHALTRELLDFVRARA
jgi:HPt (histidine-containing phosphotransfer) domain-containing protein